MSGGSDRNVGRVWCSAEREEVSQVRGRVRLKEAHCRVGWGVGSVNRLLQ
jgi:hypothetical protein